MQGVAKSEVLGAYACIERKLHLARAYFFRVNLNDLVFERQARQRRRQGPGAIHGEFDETIRDLAGCQQVFLARIGIIFGNVERGLRLGTHGVECGFCARFIVDLHQETRPARLD